MKKLLLVPICLLSFLAMGQSDSLLLLHYFQPEKGLMLKWLPASYDVFEQGFRSGYNLYRAEIEVVNGVEKAGGFVRLNTKPFTYWPYEKLEEEMKRDPDLESARIFIDGAEEVLSRAPADNMASAVDEAKSRDFIHVLASFAVISKNKVAEALGMYYLDNTVSPDKKYLYKVEVAGKPELHNFLLVFPLKNVSAEKVFGLTARLTPGAVYLGWFNNNNKNFPYYNIYRAEKKGGPYIKLNDIPMTGTAGNADFSSNTSMYVDSIKQYNKTFYYKISGVNAFEREGVASDPVEIKTFYMLKTAPVISGSSNPQGQDIDVSWAVDPEDKPYIRGFSVFRAAKAEGPYIKVSKELIKPEKQSFLDQTEKSSSNYYVISAYGSGGDSLLSLMHAHLLVDSVPPSKPVIVSGICDSNGIVTIHWKRNTERDMLGYRVFKSDRLEGEPLRVIPGHTADTMIVDTVDLKRPFNKVYYRIAAIDQHFNPSVPSEYIHVVLPDINPPVNGFFKEYMVGMNGIKLTWENSGAYDLKSMHLLRKSDEEFEYRLIKSFGGDSLKIAEYTDTNTRAFVTYDYVLDAEDFAGLRSGYSNVLSVQQLDKRKIQAVTNLRAIVSRDNKMIKLSWDFPANAKGFRVYRSRNGGPLEVYEFVKGDKREFYDTWLKPKSSYIYLMIAELAGGYESGYSNKIEVIY